MLNSKFDFYGFNVRLSQREQLRFIDQTVVKLKDQKMIKAQEDMEILQNSINEVYRLLIEAQNEAAHYKKQTEFDLNIIKEIMAKTQKERSNFQREFEEKTKEFEK